jgi:hypothetical protein
VGAGVGVGDGVAIGDGGRVGAGDGFQYAPGREASGCCRTAVPGFAAGGVGDAAGLGSGLGCGSGDPLTSVWTS